MIVYQKIDVFLKPSRILPHKFIGSTLRGAFGVSLKKVVCINPSYSCDGCFAKDNCIYYDFFEQKNQAHQYRFDFELNPKSYDFSLYLFEDATEKLPYIISTLHKMLTEQGLGVKREKFQIQSMRCNDKLIYKDDKFDLKDIKPQKFKIDELPKSISIKLKTPLRMKYKKQLLNQKPPLETLLYSIQNRLTEIKKEPKAKLTFKPTYKEKFAKVRFQDQTRRSNRQKTKLQIGGILGEIGYEMIDQKSLILLKVGEILGVGKQTVFGMGKIEVKSL
jgi:CRISPR-associated endoribonuclease Cas6